MTNYKISYLNKKGKVIFEKIIKWESWLVVVKDNTIIFTHENKNIAHVFKSKKLIFEEI